MSIRCTDGDSVHASRSVSREKKSAGLNSLRIYRGTNRISSCSSKAIKRRNSFINRGRVIPDDTHDCLVVFVETHRMSAQLVGEAHNAASDCDELLHSNMSLELFGQ
jgi:hypothetical protein